MTESELYRYLCNYKTLRERLEKDEWNGFEWTDEDYKKLMGTGKEETEKTIKVIRMAFENVRLRESESGERLTRITEAFFFEGMNSNQMNDRFGMAPGVITWVTKVAVHSVYEVLHEIERRYDSPKNKKTGKPKNAKKPANKRKK